MIDGFVGNEPNRNLTCSYNGRTCGDEAASLIEIGLAAAFANAEVIVPAKPRILDINLVKSNFNSLPKFVTKHPKLVQVGRVVAIGVLGRR